MKLGIFKFQDTRIGLKCLILLALTGFSAPFVTLQLAAQNGTKRPQSTIEFEVPQFAVGSAEPSTKRLRLVRELHQWELYDPKNGVNLSDYARDQFRLTPYAQPFTERSRYQTRWHEWILDFDFRKARIKTRGVSADFAMKAWLDYRQRFSEDLLAFNRSLMAKGQNTAAELYATRHIIERGVANAWSNPNFQQLVKKLVRVNLEEFLSTQVFKWETDYKFEKDGKLWNSEIKGRLRVQLDLDVDALQLQFRRGSQFATIGHINLSQPLKGVRVRVDSLEVISDLFSNSFSIQKEDQLEIDLALVEEPISVEASLAWNPFQNRPQISVTRDAFESPLKKMQLKAIRFRGQEFKPGVDGLLPTFLNNPDAWKIMIHSLTGAPFLNLLTGDFETKIRENLRKFQDLDLDLALIHTGAGSPLKNQRRVVERSQVGSNLMEASFRVKLPLKIEAVPSEIRPGMSPLSASGGLSLQIETTVLEFSNVQIYREGKPLLNEPLAVKAYLVNRDFSPTKIEARAGINVAIHEGSSTPSLDVELENLNTNLEALGVDRFEVYLDGKWIETAQLGMKFFAENLPSFRNIFLEAGPQGAASLAETFVSELKTHVRPELTKRIEEAEFDASQRIPFQALGRDGLVQTGGKIKVARLVLDQWDLEMLDRSEQGPSCEGVYLLSARTQVFSRAPFRFQARAISMDVDLSGKKVLVVADGALVELKNQDGATRFRLGMDVCLHPSYQSADIKIYELSQNLHRLQINEFRMRNLVSDRASLNLLKMSLGSNADEMISSWIQSALTRAQKDFESLIAQQIQAELQKTILAFLNSQRVKGEIADRLREIEKVDQKFSDLAYHFGAQLKAPIENFLRERIEDEYRKVKPELESRASRGIQMVEYALQHIGEIVGMDLEENLYASFQDVLFGAGSPQAQYAHIFKTLAPSHSLLEIKNLALGTQELRDMSETFRILNVITPELVHCPVEDADTRIAKIMSTIENEASLTFDQKEDVRTFLKERCDPIEVARKHEREAGPASPKEGWIASLYQGGLQSLEDLSLSEAVRAAYRVPESSIQLASATENSRSQGQASLIPEDLDPQFKLTRVEFSEIAGGLPALTLGFGSEKWPNAYPVLKDSSRKFIAQKLEADPSQIIFRSPREFLNVLLQTVPWGEIIAARMKLRSRDQLVVEQMPFLNARGELQWAIYLKKPFGKLELVVAPVVEFLAGFLFQKRVQVDDDSPKVRSRDIAAFLLSFLNLRSSIEARVQTRLAVDLSLQSNSRGESFVHIDLEHRDTEVDSTLFLEDAIRFQVEQVVAQLDRGLNEALSDLTTHSTFSALSSRLRLHALDLHEGDLFFSLKIEDEDESIPTLWVRASNEQ